jgi:hypothetical protein
LIAGLLKSTKSVRGGPEPIMNPFIGTQGHKVVSEELKNKLKNKLKKKGLRTISDRTTLLVHTVCKTKCFLM